jgi:hypothetical protein
MLLVSRHFSTSISETTALLKQTCCLCLDWVKKIHDSGRYGHGAEWRTSCSEREAGTAKKSRTGTKIWTTLLPPSLSLQASNTNATGKRASTRAFIIYDTQPHAVVNKINLRRPDSAVVNKVKLRADVNKEFPCPRGTSRLSYDGR